MSKTFKKFLAENNAQVRVRNTVRQLFKTDQYTQRNSIDEKILDDAKSVDHKFIDTPAGAWVAELLQVGNQQYVEVSPPKGMEVPCVYFIKNAKEPEDAEEEDTEEAVAEALALAESVRPRAGSTELAYDSKRFTYNPKSKTFSAEASEIGSGFLKQIWGDSADRGFGIKSKKTGNVAIFTLTDEHKNRDQEITHWEFSVYNPKRDPKLSGLKAIIWND